MLRQSSQKKEKPVRAVLDTNVLISALLYGGSPREVLRLATDGEVIGITLPALLEELSRILVQKFSAPSSFARAVLVSLSDSFEIVEPKQRIHILADEPDNRVLEAGVEGRVDYIVTGDKALLALKSYKRVRIVSIEEFRKQIEN